MSSPDRAHRPAALGGALFALHVALLLALPPIPPIHNGFSVPSYLLAYVAVILVVVGIGRGGPAAVEERAGRIGTAGWRVLALAVVLAIVAAALLLRELAPGTYFRFWREEGVFEPLTFLAYLGGGILLWRTAGRLAGRGRPWRLAAAGFGLLALEEIDYLGIFGGMIGRIGGEYAGSLHDILRLAVLGLVGGLAWGILAAIALGVGLALWRTGYLDFGWLLGRARRPEALWVLLGAALLGVAAAEEAHLLGWVAAQPTPEEAVELGGGLSLALWAVESAARRARDFASRGEKREFWESE